MGVRHDLRTGSGRIGDIYRDSVALAHFQVSALIQLTDNDFASIIAFGEVRAMSKSDAKTAAIDWPVDGPLALENYVAAVESEQMYRRTLADVLSEIQSRLNFPATVPPPSADEVRALFDRYQESSPAQEKLLSEMVADMREE
jgi:hypothetical protein